MSRPRSSVRYPRILQRSPRSSTWRSCRFPASAFRRWWRCNTPRSLTPNATAVHVATDDERSAEIEANWQQWGQGIPLVIVESPYRSLTGPLMQYLLEIKKLEAANLVTVILPEYVPDHWWEHIPHGQSAQVLKLALLFTPGFVVTSVPVHERTRVAT
jgi:hypothetical protein